MQTYEKIYLKLRYSTSQPTEHVYSKTTFATFTAQKSVQMAHNECFWVHLPNVWQKETSTGKAGVAIEIELPFKVSHCIHLLCMQYTDRPRIDS